MKAIILIGGEATRLRPLTCNTPKAMVPVLNTPFLEHVIGYLSQHQVKEIVLTLSRSQESIQGYFGDGSQFGVRLNYAIEDTPLGTAGAVKNAEKYLDETFLVLNGDIFTDLDITAMIQLHRHRKAKVTIALTPVDDPTSYGLVETSAQGKATRFLEKPSWSEITTNMINAGTYILEPEVLAYIPPQANFSFEHGLFPTLLGRGEPVYAYPSSAYWIDIGTPEKYLRLHRDLLGGKSNQYTLASGEEVVIGRQSYIHPTAQIKGPAVVGSNCIIGENVKLTGPVVIGAGCKISREASVEEAILWQGVLIGERVVLRHSMIANNVFVGTDALISDGCVVGDSTVVEEGNILEHGIRISPGKVDESERKSSIEAIRTLLERTDQEILRQLLEMGPTEFEKLVGILFQDMFRDTGCQILVTKTTRDGGVDIIVKHGKLKSIVQCKRFHGVVGVQVVRDLFGTMLNEEAYHGFLVSTGTFSQDARCWAMGKPLYLVDYVDLLKWVRDYGSPSKQKRPPHG